MSRPAEWLKRRWSPVMPSALVAAVAVAVLVWGTGCGGDDLRSDLPTVDEPTSAAAERFLDRYMREDGRVVRENGDTVSAGQAYAMLASVAIDDRERFDLAWDWARRNLQREDGLLSSRWRGGKVADEEAASDADLDAARALIVATDRFGDRDYLAHALRMGESILTHETLKVDGGRVLVAGPWARYGDAPYPINPSYFSPRAIGALTKASGNRRFGDVNQASYWLADALIGDPLPLVPDWALLNASGEVRPARRKGTLDPMRHGLDAARVPVRFAEACVEDRRALAARLLPFYERRVGDQPAIAYRLDGEVLDPATHAMPLVAAAGAAHAAGEERLRDSYLARAEQLERRSPTYYGSAWVALGRIMLTSEALGRCPR